uniref:Uncharacterized protein n=1 Tax=Anguilla anguilla TaxID=7936 RepID=A0A0E9Q8D7_ANGAN
MQARIHRQNGHTRKFTCDAISANGTCLKGL